MICIHLHSLYIWCLYIFAVYTVLISLEHHAAGDIENMPRYLPLLQVNLQCLCPGGALSRAFCNAELQPGVLCLSLPYLSCRKWQGGSTHVWHHMLPLRHVIDNREGRHIGFERASWMASVDRSFLDGKRSERSLCSVKGREVIWKSREGSVSQRETGEALSWGTLPLRLWAPCTNLGAKHSSCQCSVFSDFSPWLVISACALNGGNCVCCTRLQVQELRTAEVKLEPIK